MKNKGFTLIELLAVIVILAIIALIAVPIILNIIDSSKTSANERSKELYLDAVEQAIAREKMKDIDFNPENCVVQTDGNLICDEKEPKIVIETNGTRPTGGTITLQNGKVKSETLVFGDGVKEETPTQVFKPQYYGIEYGVIGNSLTSDALTIPPEDKSAYLGFYVEGDKITAIYSCFIRNETEYCLKGLDTEAYETNVNILKEAYADIVDTVCEHGDDYYACQDDGINGVAYSNGDVNTNNGLFCSVTGASGECM